MLSTALDTATKDMTTAAGIMVGTAMAAFPVAEEVSKVMPLGIGMPGTVAQGAGYWLSGANDLQAAQQELTSLCSGLSSDDWSGSDRDAFDGRISDMAAQLGDAHNLAELVGVTLTGLSAPLAAYGPVCLGIGIILLEEAIDYFVAVASVVGDFGASEALQAAGDITAATCATVLTTYVATMGAAMEAGAVAFEGAMGVDVKKQEQHGDANAANDFKQAEVQSIGEVANNLEKLAFTRAAGWAAGKVVPSTVPGVTSPGAAALASVGKSELAGRAIDDNNAVLDLAENKDPSQVLKDLTAPTGPEQLFADSDPAIALPENIAEIINEGVNWKEHG